MTNVIELVTEGVWVEGDLNPDRLVSKTMVLSSVRYCVILPVVTFSLNAVMPVQYIL